MVAKFRKSKKNPYQTLFFSIFLGLLFSVMVGFLVFSNWKITQRRAELTTKIEALKKEIQILEEKNQQLRAGILQIEKESYWEEKIRQEGYKKPGEEQVVVLPPEEKELKEEEKNLWNPQNWLEWIKSKFAGLVQW